MNKRELQLFAALTNIGDDLIEESFAFLPAEGGAADGATVGTPKRAGKRPVWFLPAVIAACAAFVASAGIAVAVLGNSFQLFPFGPSDTTEEGTIGVSEGEPTDETGEGATEAPTDTPTETPTEEPTEPGTDAEPETEETTEELTDALPYSKGLYYGANGEGTCYVKGIGTCTDEIIVIPSEHGGRAVNAIGINAFASAKIKGVIIPHGVTEIQQSAFPNCTELTSVVIPDGVTAIGGFAFYGCQNLTSITIPSSVTSFGKYMLFQCPNLTDVYYMGTEEEWEAIPKPYEWRTGSPFIVHYNCTP